MALLCKFPFLAATRNPVRSSVEDQATSMAENFLRPIPAFQLCVTKRFTPKKQEPGDFLFSRLNVHMQAFASKIFLSN